MTILEKPIRLLLVDDDPGWITAMTTYLNREPDLIVAGTAAEPMRALELAASETFDVALLDINLTGGDTDGISLALELTALKPEIKPIMLTSLDNEAVIRQAFTAGALNYMTKANYRDLPPAIRSAHRASFPMEVLVKELARLKREEQLSMLTPAEREIFELLEQGYTHSQIEGKLYKAESTLKNQINRLLKKLGVRSGKEAVENVRRRGIFRR